MASPAVTSAAAPEERRMPPPQNIPNIVNAAVAAAPGAAVPATAVPAAAVPAVLRLKVINPTVPDHVEVTCNKIRWACEMGRVGSQEENMDTSVLD